VTQPAAPLFPPGRYGRRRERGRRSPWVRSAVIVVVALALLWLSLRLYGRYGSTGYQPGAVRYGEVTPTRVTVTFDLHKRAGPAGICRLVATDRSGAETGYAEVQVGTGDHITVTSTIDTRARAVLVDILGCRDAPR
jgi:Domain of unknown function (DUF4307)